MIFGALLILLGNLSAASTPGPKPNRLEAFSHCRAVAARDEKECQSLPPESAEDCRRRYLDDRFIKALLDGDPEAQKYCRAHEHRRFKDTVKACALFFKKWKDPAALATSLQPLYKEKPDDAGLKAWEIKFRTRMGEEDYCSRAAFTDELQTCRYFAEYRRAKASGNRKLCGDSVYCRALMGEGVAACAPLAPHPLKDP